MLSMVFRLQGVLRGQNNQGEDISWLTEGTCFLLASEEHLKIGNSRLFVTNRHLFENVDARREFSITEIPSEEFFVEVLGHRAPVRVREFVCSQDYKDRHSIRV